jgi:transposase
MGRVNTPNLSELEKQELQTLMKKSNNDSLRRRCHLILLKANGRKSKDVGAIVGMSHVSVNSWLARFVEEGIRGLYIKPGRGKKPVLCVEKDKESILTVVKNHRQKVSSAKAEWEASSNKSVSETTFKRFLKSLVEDINA